MNVLTTETRFFLVTFEACSELFRGKRISPELFLDIDLPIDFAVTSAITATVLIPRYLITDFVDTVSGFTDSLNFKPIFDLETTGISEIRTRKVRAFLEYNFGFRHMACDYWPIFDGNASFKQVKNSI